MSSLINNPAPLYMSPELTKKKPIIAGPTTTAAASTTTAATSSSKSLNASGDKANLIEFWRNPEAGNIYRHAEHLTSPVTPCLVEHSKLCQTVSSASASTKMIHVMDMCCGTGVVSSYIQKMMRELPGQQRERVRLTSADSSEAQLGVVKEKIEREEWVGSEVKQADIMNMSFPSDQFDVVIVAMALMLVADPYTSLNECYRVTKPGGTVATSTWVTEGWIPDTRDAVASLTLPGPNQQPVSWPQSSIELTSLWGPGAWESPSFVKSMFTAAGFVDVEVDVVTKWVPFSGVDEWCTVFQAFMYGVMERFWTRAQREGLKGRLMPTLRAFMEEKYQGRPFEVERTVLLARGRKPE
ncbi:S-adenosyl-L-methionine-dependent methyltransferase [Colletotrichum godetiae]|uniref:S-adenosyl-L-methionine-dependent methyltransferase n=1 Tax=Colletotrichum godetiae TaxID=1209918 RepID=A0AAJ0AE25_9PEZI|nr:S-adenosyl-L-methionine-dependent methyltransferase [Colletotrichum godetiae]KAK1672176.1 S-adenosyl-L-methionine-dependent methyltransferase [Colletotrichum godetiae]